MSINLKFVIN